MRKAFNFYQSHWEQIKLLNDSQKLDLFNSICKVQFLEVNIDDISFKDNISTLVWTGIKHSINTSITGFINKNKGLNKEVIIPLAKGGINAPCQQLEEKGEEKEEEKEQYVKPFSFSLTTKKQLSNTSKEYKEKLEHYIKTNFKGMTYQEFYDSCEMKGYQYKNYKMVYDKWNRDNPKNIDNNLVPKNMIGLTFKYNGMNCQFTEKGYQNFTRDYEITKKDDVEKMIKEITNANK